MDTKNDFQRKYSLLSQDGQFTDTYRAFAMYQDLLKVDGIAKTVFLPKKAVVEVFQSLNQFPRICYDVVDVKWK